MADTKISALNGGTPVTQAQVADTDYLTGVFAALTGKNGNIAFSVLRKVLGILQNNLTSTRDPLPSDDASAGYTVGSRWLRTNTRDEWRCVDSTTGAAVWLKADIADQDGYKAGKYYLPMLTPQVIAGANPGTVGLITLIPGVLKQRVAISDLIVRVTTAGAGNVAAAIYRRSGDTPTTLLANTGSMDTSVAGSAIGNLGSTAPILEAGPIYSAVMMDNTTAALMCAVASTANSTFSAVVGSASTTMVLLAQGFGGYSTPGTFGTWPADLSAAARTELSSNRAGVVAFRATNLP